MCLPMRADVKCSQKPFRYKRYEPKCMFPLFDSRDFNYGANQKVQRKKKKLQILKAYKSIRADPVREYQLAPVLQIRDVYPGSRIRIFPSRNQGNKDSGSRIRIRIKEFKYF
jgi:hypothetical protein